MQVGVDSSYTAKDAVHLLFTCSKCQLENKAGEKSIVETSTGEAYVAIYATSHKWNLHDIRIWNDDRSYVFAKSDDHTF